jgi:hypothetical protein
VGFYRPCVSKIRIFSRLFCSIWLNNLGSYQKEIEVTKQCCETLEIIIQNQQVTLTLPVVGVPVQTEVGERLPILQLLGILSIFATELQPPSVLAGQFQEQDQKLLSEMVPMLAILQFQVHLL